MQYDIRIGNWKVGMLDSVEIHSSVELLADTATIVLPGAEYNKALDVEGKIKRGDKLYKMSDVNYCRGLRDELYLYLEEKDIVLV